MDPRNPKRPLDESGDNWAICRGCNRGARKARLIRHGKHCTGGGYGSVAIQEPLAERRAAENRLPTGPDALRARLPTQIARCGLRSCAE